MSQSKLDEIIALFKKRHIELNPPTTMETVRKVEAQYHITLPQEYVLFITTVGNGGTLPDSSGLKHLSKYIYPIEQCDFEKATLLFLYEEAWNWEYDDTYNSEADPERKIAATQYGHFAFAAPDDGEGYTWHLIVNGPCSGEVWGFTDWKMCRGKSVDFLDWVLDCVKRSFSKGYIDPDDNNSANDLDDRIEQLKKKLKRKKLKPRSLISEEQIQDIERRYGVKLPQEYSLFLSKVGNGFAPADNSSEKFMNPLTEQDLTRISQPFPLENMWSFVINECQHPKSETIYTAPDNMWHKVQCGYLILSTEKKRNLPIEQVYLLIVNGVKAGEIWCLSYYTAKGEGQYGCLGKMSFLDWLEGYLNGFSL